MICRTVLLSASTRRQGASPTLRGAEMILLRRPTRQRTMRWQSTLSRLMSTWVTGQVVMRHATSVKPSRAAAAISAKHPFVTTSRDCGAGAANHSGILWAQSRINATSTIISVLAPQLVFLTLRRLQPRLRRIGLPQPPRQIRVSRPSL